MDRYNNRGSDRFGSGRGRGGRDDRRGGRDGGRPEMYEVVCDGCGRDCEVPFKPTGSKPVFCSDCFSREDDRNDRRDSFGGGRGRRDDRGSRDRGGRDFGEKRMYKVVCDDCGEECEVPFKPTSSKPIFCEDCFSKEGRNPSKPITYEEDFKILNQKLDTIIAALEKAGLKEPKKKIKLEKNENDEVVGVEIKEKKTKKTTKKQEEEI